MPESFEKQTLKTIVELVVTQRDNDERNFNKVTASIEALTLNIAQLTAQQKQTANNLDKIGERLDRMITAIDSHLAVAQSQSANIAGLTELGTMVVSSSR